MFYEPPLPLFNNNKKIEPSIYIYMYISGRFLLGDMSLVEAIFFFAFFWKKEVKTIFSHLFKYRTALKLNSHLLMDRPRNAGSVVDAPNLLSNSFI